MSRTILKYVIDMHASKTNVVVPLHAELLSVGNQHGQLVLWVLANIDHPTTQRTVHLSLTGQEHCEDAGRFLGTVLFAEGAYVVHVFEEK